MKRENIVKVGERIKYFREQKGLSLKELSDRTGYSESILSQIENHLISPPLGALLTVAKALELSVGNLLGEEKEEPFIIDRKGQEVPVSRVASKEGVNYGYTYKSLGFGKKDRHFEPFLITLEPSPLKPQGLSKHQGEEFIYVLNGEMEVQLRDFKEILKEGDSIYYNSEIPHRVSCVGDKPANILAIIWSPGKEENK
ncbi:MAG: cupin domain-containing protein [Proteobacteria bacterium]|nr:cupin domain-containing protein [Pseudomonadota bacterium]